MGIRVLVLALYLLLINACAHQAKVVYDPDHLTMTDIYLQSMGKNYQGMGEFFVKQFKAQQFDGYVKPYVPVMQAPVVKKVWVPNHQNKEDPNILVTGHWVFLMVQGPKWFIGQEVKGQLPLMVVPGKKEIIEKGN